MRRERRGGPRASSAARLARCVPMRVVLARRGLRGGRIPDVLLVGGAGPYEVDVLVRRRRDGRIDLIGQVTGAERVNEPACGLLLALYDASAETCLAQVETDRFGEFEARGLEAGAYVLALGPASDAPCMLVAEGGAHAACTPAV